MCNQKDKSIHGIKVRNVNIIMTVLAIGLCVLVLVSSFKIKKGYDQSVASITDYSDCSKAVNDIRDSTDYLTNQARLFTVNNNPIFIKRYFYELKTLRRIDIGLEIIQMSHSGDLVESLVKMAINEAKFLEETEIYAMKLVCEASEIAEDLPEEVVAVKLSTSDAELSAADKIKRAQEILTDSHYLNSKDNVSTYTKNALDDLVNTYIGTQRQSDNRIKISMDKEMIYIISLIVVSIILFSFLMLFVLNPLEFHIDSILHNSRMKEKGSYELKYIAKAYNNLCEKNEVKATLLRHKAEHDPLTDLINREAFDQIKHAFSETEEPLAYLIIDIDFFKQINDNFGHPIGDEILKKIASLLMETFRQTDYVARIGGDEFAVIMTKFGTSAIEIIQRKIDGLNSVLQNVEDGLPSVSLSVGVAFSENGFVPALVEQADKALYRVKKGGRCNCSFYKGEE